MRLPIRAHTTAHKHDKHVGHQLTDQLAGTLRVDAHERTLRGLAAKTGHRHENIRQPSGARSRPASRQDGPVRFRAVTIVLTSVLLLVACTRGGSSHTHARRRSRHARAAAELAAGLAKKDVSAVEFAGANSAAVNDELKAVLAGMGPLAPSVQVGQVNGPGQDGHGRDFEVDWTFPGVSEPWAYETSAQLVDEAGRWKSSWQPSVVQPDLDGSNRLSQRRLYPERGEVRGDGGIPIVSLRAVVRIGIDKARVNAEQAKTSAARLARLLRIDSDSYVSTVGVGRF